MANVTDLIINGESSNRVDIVFMGDGYTDSEIASAYTSQIDSYLAYMFEDTALTEPFGTYAKFFNIHRIDVISEQSGADNQETGTYVNTALNARYYWDGITARLLYVDDSVANLVLAESLANKNYSGEMRFIAVNSETYGGGGGNYAVFAGGNMFAHEIALHEIAHSFAALADEYGDNIDPYTGSEPFEANVTTDPAGSKWQDWIGYSDANLGVIGAYDGGRYYEHGIYRPSLNSKMRELNQPFDAVSREQFILKFYDYVDPLDDYLSNAAPLVNVNVLHVTPIDSSVIAVDWTVNGVAAGHGDSFNMSQFVTGLGAYTVTARAYDNTGWVRSHLDQVEEQVSWTVTLTAGNATTGNDRLLGTLLGDYLVGLAGNDAINGGNGDDAIFGDAGDDVLKGWSGADTMVGGLGNDTFLVENIRDVMTEKLNEGTDTVSSRIAYILPAHVEKLVLTGTSAINGTGNGLANVITGNSAANELNGLAGNDTLDGGLGANRLTGGTGNDIFKFTSRGAIDVITDFNVANDTIQLENSIFTALTPTGTLGAGRFRIGAQAIDANDFIIYNNTTGALLYDANGNGAGSAIQIAAIGTGLALTNADFAVI